MKQITAKNQMTKVIYRFRKNQVFVKCNNLQHSRQIISQLEDRGWIITQSSSWIRCEYPRELIKLDEGETDVDIEMNFINLFLMNLRKAGFEIKLEEIEE